MCSICDARDAHGLPSFFWAGDLSAALVPVAVLPAEVFAAAANPDGKPSLDLSAAAAQITRNDRKWEDGNPATQAGGDANALGTPGTVTYGYLANGGIDASLAGVDDVEDHRALTAAEIAQVEYAISLIEAVADIDFVRVGSGMIDAQGDAEIAIMGEIGTNGGYAATAAGGGTIYRSLVNIGTSGLATEGSYAFSTALHELGHALGLSHPASYDASDDAAPSYADSAIYFEDSRQFSLMSYFGEEETGARFNGRHPLTMMLHDVAALQRLYGANLRTRTGDDVYGANSATGDRGFTLDDSADYFVGAIWDAGGTDTIDMSVYVADQVIDLRQTAFSSTGGMVHNLAIAAGTVIENAIGGGGSDRLIGNDADNLLDGGAAGEDTASYEDASVGVVIDLTAADGVQVTGAGTDTLRGIENVVGGAGDDRLVGTTDSNRLEGGAGDDTLVANGGLQDVVLGGAGRDLADLSGADYGLILNIGIDAAAMRVDGEITVRGIEDVIASAFDDEVLGSGEANRLDGGDGADTLVGFGGADVLRGGAGDDLIYGDAGGGYEPIPIEFIGTDGDDTLIGNVADNILRGLGGDDYLEGGEGADTLEGGDGDDFLEGMDGDDSLVAGAGADTLEGGAGNDTLIATDGDQAGGGAGDDLLLGSDGIDTLFGGAGDDVLRGGGGGDDLSGGDGRDTLDGGDGDDRLLGQAGGDELSGGAGRDTLEGGDGADRVLGGADADLIRGGGNGEALDTLAGEGGDDTIYGGAGSDYILGGSGTDRLFGEAGDDFLTGNAGADTLDGGAGDDRAYFYDSADGVGLDLAAGLGTAGDAAGDTFVSIEGVYGSAQGADTLLGSDGDDYLEGWGGNDRLEGGLGDDLLVGGDGSDTVLGGGGDDLLFGGGRDDSGMGASIVTGGAGADRFAILGKDDGATTVTDFEDGTDRLDLSRVDVFSLADVAVTAFVQDGVTGTLIGLADGTATLFLEGVAAGQIDETDFVFA